MSDEEEGEKTYTIIFDDEPSVVHKFLPPKDGKATATWPNGDTFVGEYKDGKRTGKGVYRLTSGASYDGDYIENKKSGFGEYVSPDGGKYTGEWLNDKRHGQGTYKYPNGDVYTGYWKNGAKHGRGSYSYKNNGTSITGVWSNGQVVDGSWTSHDGGKYMGAFLNNVPAGEGIFVHSNGNTGVGVYADGQFKQEVFAKPHPNTQPPEPQYADHFKKATRTVDKAVARTDHYNTMYILKPEHDGIPNFRRVGSTSVFGSAQPTQQGLKKLAEVLGEGGVDKTTWISVREDPTFYVNGLPMALRDRKKTDTTMTLPGVGVKEMAELETRVMENTKFLTKKKGNLHEYFADEYDPVSNERKENQLCVEVKTPDDIKTTTSMFEALAEDDTPVAYSRVMLAENGNPSVDQIDAFAQNVRGQEGSMVFVDGNGGDRVTMAQVLALLITNQEAAAAEGEEGEEEAGGDEGDEGAAKKEAKVEKVYNPEEPDFEAGEFGLVMRLVSKLNGEETEAETREREAAEEAAKETAAAEAMKKYEEEQLAKEEAAAAAAAAAEAAAAEGGEGDEPEAEKPAEEEAAEGEGDGEAKPAEDEAAPEKTLEEIIEEAKAAVPTGAPPVSTDGTDAKKRADAAVDKTSACGNLRTQIIELKAKYEESQDKAILDQAREKLHAYVNTILFAVYLKAYAAAPPPEAAEPAEGEEEAAAPTGLTFKAYRDTIAETVMKIGSSATGEISEFYWE